MEMYDKAFDGIAAVLFDLDGTLVDSNEAHARSWVDVFAEHGHQVDLSIAKSLIGLGGDKLIVEAIGPVSEELNKAIDKRRSEIFRETYLKDVVGFDKGNELIVLLKEQGLTVLLASASSKEDRDAILKRGDLTGQFHDMADNEEVDDSKPAPDTLLVAIQNTEVEPHQCLLIGDTPYDGEAAHKAGMRFLGVETGGYNSERLTTAVAVVPSITSIYEDLLRERS